MVYRSLLRRVACATCALGFAAAVAAGAGAAAPGGAAAPAAVPVVWATQICNSLNSWQNTLERGTGALSGKPRPSRAALLRTIGAFVAETGTLQTALDRAGTPALPLGGAIEQALQHAVNTFAGALARDRTQARKLPAGAGQGSVTIASAIARQSRTVGTTFIHLGGTYHAPELDDAFDQVPQCGLIHG